jgi:AmmeMemoRadiSam system protein A
MNFDLDPAQKKTLLALARSAIAVKLGLDADEPALDDPVFHEKLGAFVTLHRDGDLRGCIGIIEPVLPLVQTIREMAVSAAFRDPRFSPLQAREFSLIDIEISVLSPISVIQDEKDVVVGRDGLIISRGGRRGLLLPQVATEYGWDAVTFLQHTCHKAGLAADAWHEQGTVIERFSAVVFGEKQ